MVDQQKLHDALLRWIALSLLVRTPCRGKPAWRRRASPGHLSMSTRHIRQLPRATASWGSRSAERRRRRRRGVHHHAALDDFDGLPSTTSSIIAPPPAPLARRARARADAAALVLDVVGELVAEVLQHPLPRHPPRRRQGADGSALMFSATESSMRQILWATRAVLDAVPRRTASRAFAARLH